MKPEDTRKLEFLKLLNKQADADKSEALLEKYREYANEFDPSNTSPDSLSEATREALEFIEKGARTPMSEENRARYIAHLEKLSFIRAKLEQE